MRKRNSGVDVVIGFAGGGSGSGSWVSGPSRGEEEGEEGAGQ